VSSTAVWPTTRLSAVTSRIGSGITPRGGASVYVQRGRPFVRSQNVGRGVLLLDELAFIDEQTHATFKASELRAGDVLLNITGASIGRSAVATEVLDAGNVNQHVCVIRLDQSCMDPVFVCAVLLSDLGQRQIASLQAGGNREGLNFRQIGSIVIPKPPLPEQQAIAGASVDLARLVDRLERELRKKEDLKQALMQQLLRGERRVSGSSEPWVRLHVASHSMLEARIGWQGLTTSEYRSSGTYRLVGGTEFRDGRIAWEQTPYVDKHRFDQDRGIQLRPGDVLLTKDGTIGKTAYVDELPGPATLNSGVFLIRPVRQAYDSRFLYYVLRSRAFDEFLTRLSAGSTISHLYQRDLTGFAVEVPPTLKEQEEIAEILVGVDQDLDLVRARITKAKQVELGAMQELLSGRTRLPAADGARA
jgi:type I restriction enzyme S subunit